MQIFYNKSIDKVNKIDYNNREKWRRIEFRVDHSPKQILTGGDSLETL
ncbi:hypothetical protein TRIP_C20054 [Candidatus Zixiibacteriota bacterium]|nr:hypothetical protein TRIP_C20054 [candidate division Zixibacteria bacterium]